MGMLPGVAKMKNQIANAGLDDKLLKRQMAIIDSMTPQERGRPHLIDGSRRQRIAAGSGQTIQDVNKLLSARKQMEKMMKQVGKGKMPNLQSIVAQQRR